MGMVELTIVMPSFNEEVSLTEIIQDLLNKCELNNWDLIIVNDGSTDQTYSILKKFEHSNRVKVISHKINKGYGGALKSGILGAETEFVITMDADGQHRVGDVSGLLDFIKTHNADMVVGKREYDGNHYRTIGKKAIRFFARMLMNVPVEDLNSGMKIYRTELVKKYLKHCPDGMAFSDIITLLFIYNRHLVLETPIELKNRKHGKSTINYRTAINTVYEILNIVLMFNPIKIFLPTGLVFIIAGIAWGIPIALADKGISVGASLSISVGILIIFFGLLAEQISQIRKNI